MNSAPSLHIDFSCISKHSLKMEVEDELQFWKESLPGISEKLFPRAEVIEHPTKRSKRKPNFTAPERMHLARAYVENIEEYNRGFTSATRGDAKHGRQRLLEKWAAELTAFGVVERTTVEIEQKLRDYMKKIIGNSRRPHRRPLSPAAELLSTVIPQCSATNAEESSPASDPQTEYADFLLQQHRATSNESVENNSIAEPEPECTPGPAIDLTVHIDETTRMQRTLLAQQLENARAEHTLKLIAIENARIEQKLKQIELEKRRLELEALRHRQRNLIVHTNGSTSHEIRLKSENIQDK
ncbi:hypothetical protein Tcan_17758 [Toxocara canis]|uniref:Regulatory protein zeste n=1 Tax=Toxocara canis TaxID=6265 RepID=A0A0B2W4W4_TOXCA|nr:hypothetical protein Tcan_17758 [Toxocara canis]